MGYAAVILGYGTARNPQLAHAAAAAAVILGYWPTPPPPFWATEPPGVGYAAVILGYWPTPPP